MKNTQRQAAALMALLSTMGLQAQVVNNGGLGDYRLTLNGNAPRSFTIGSAFMTGASAFNIRGDQMGGTSVTPEVFRTVAPTTGNTFWRMFQGGTSAAFERGQLFAVLNQNHFNINAPNGHFQLHTQNVLRTRLNGNVNGTIGAFNTINRDGFLLLSGQPNAFVDANSRAPFTRLHLIDNVGTASPLTYAQELGYRPWMRNGITFTGNSDQSYIGHRYGAVNDNTDFVIQWSDNPSGSPWGVDRMKFVFSTTYDPNAVKGAATLNGMEAMRFWPRSNTEVNVGVGDFAPAAVGDPTERLDILDGRLRIRQLPNDPSANYLNKVLVVEDFPLIPGERGVVKWRDASTLGNPCASGWNMVGNNPVTAYDGNPCPPQSVHRVGIGLSDPVAKLDVLRSGTGTVFDQGMRMQVTTTSQFKVGFDTFMQTPGLYNWGYRAKVEGASWNIGVDIAASNGPAGGRVVGGSFSAQGGGVIDSNDVVGVFAHATGAIGGATGWAFYGVGKAYLTTGQLWSTSDASLKRDVEDARSEEALEKVLALRPREFSYDTEQYGFMGLEQGRQTGFLAQEMEEVFPELVRDMTYRGRRDELGQAIEPDVEHKAVNYLGLLPTLVAAMQEQQRSITEQQRQIEELRDALLACCQRGMMQMEDEIPSAAMRSEAADRLLRIDPNPFTDRTTIRYTLERGGRMLLLVNSGDGKQLQVLQETVLEAGEYQQEWHTAQLAPGMYYLTLLLDGEPLVKRAVKL